MFKIFMFSDLVRDTTFETTNLTFVNLFSIEMWPQISFLHAFPMAFLTLKFMDKGMLGLVVNCHHVIFPAIQSTTLVGITHFALILRMVLKYFLTTDFQGTF